MSLEQLKKENASYFRGAANMHRAKDITTTSYQAGVRDAMGLVEKQLTDIGWIEQKKTLQALQALIK